ncbi:putative ABC transporter permease [Anaerotignum lactatifermentans]|uniref:putative ABC transporter permease n=1 Tax=Anaerotignum lactatifermentans TaxID=160404 RepID=UPI00307BC144
MGAFKKGQALFLYFMAYAVIGWIYEVFLEVVVYRWGFSNRGFLFGPYLPVYGFGAVIILLVLQPLKKKRIAIGKINVTPILVFLGIVALTTGLELLTSYIMEWTTGGWLWDYDRFAWNFQGRIALNPSIRFGIGGMFFLYCVQPLLEKANGTLTEKMRSLLSGSLFVLICVDFFYHIFLKV